VKNRKTFQTGEVVLFKRETWGEHWELGEYMREDATCHGWHYVRDDTGFRQSHYVPTRRIKPSPSPRAEGVLKSGQST